MWFKWYIAFRSESFRCTKRNCGKHWSCLRGTFFARTMLPVHKVLFHSYHWLAGASHDYLCSIGGFATRTATNFFWKSTSIGCRFFRRIRLYNWRWGYSCGAWREQVWEAKFNRGHHVNGIWVFGGVEITEERKVFLSIVDKRDAFTLHCLILKHVRRGSINVTDSCRGYLGLDELGYIQWG